MDCIRASSLDDICSNSSVENSQTFRVKTALPKTTYLQQTWFRGPVFLQLPSAPRPKAFNSTNEHIPEQRKQTLSMISIQTTDLVTNCKFHNDYTKLVRVFSFIGRFIHNCKNRHTKRFGPFTPQEFETSLFRIIRNLQNTHFAPEIDRIQQGMDIHHSSSLRSLSPILEEDILRVGGRIHHASLSHNTIHPILLPKHHTFTITLIHHTHKKHLHVGCPCTA